MSTSGEKAENSIKWSWSKDKPHKTCKNVLKKYSILQNFLSSFTFYPNLPIFLHRYICHICDISQLRNRFYLRKMLDFLSKKCVPLWWIHNYKMYIIFVVIHGLIASINSTDISWRLKRCTCLDFECWYNITILL